MKEYIEKLAKLRVKLERNPAQLEAGDKLKVEKVELDPDLRELYKLKMSKDIEGC